MLIFLPIIHKKQMIGTKWIEGRVFAKSNENGIRAKFMKKFQCFPYSAGPTVYFSDKMALIKPSTKRGADDLNNLVKLNFEEP